MVIFQKKNQEKTKMDCCKIRTLKKCLKQAFFTDIEKTQGKNNSPNSITQGKIPPKTQRTGSIFDWTKKLNEPVLI